jgi:hypothetical protein
MRRRGVNYDVGIDFGGLGYLSRPTFDIATTHREFAIIAHDLHCNAVRISGTDLDRLLAATEDALQQGLEVWLSPHLHDRDAHETLAYTVCCARAAESLRVRWPRLVFVLGCELTLFMRGILSGDNVLQRVGNPLNMLKLAVLGTTSKPLNAFLASAGQGVRQVFHGPVTYASLPMERVDWRPFDFVGLDYYRAKRGRNTYGAELRQWEVPGKPLVVTEVGLCAYRGAEDRGAAGFNIIDKSDRRRLDGAYVRDEGVQARELTDMLGLLDGAGVDGVFVFTFVAPTLTHSADPGYDLDMASFALVKSYADRRGDTYPDLPWDPKEAFWAVADAYARA